MVISYPDPRLKKEMESLLKNGYDVEVIMWERGWPLVNDKSIPIKSLKINAPAGGIRALLCFPLWLLFLSIWLFRLKWDVVHTVNFDTYILSLFVAKVKNKPIIYDIFDFYGDVMPSLMPSLFRNIIVHMDKLLLPFSDVLILADESRIEQIGGNIHKNVYTINNSPTDDLFKIKLDKPGFKLDNHYDAKSFRIFVGGKIVEERCLDLVISTVSEMDDVELIIRGLCDETSFKKQILQLGQKFKNVDLYLDGVPYEEIIKGTMSADLTIALYDPDIPNNKYASPNKLFEAMASEIPIIVNENTSMANIVKNENCGVIIPFRNKEALKESISCLKEDRNLQQKLGSNGRKAYENKYKWTIMEERLINIYNQIFDINDGGIECK